ncbi:Galactokinase [Clostridium sp. N3C]|uniref:mevalonate kinase n=1 Tax=Clostridium sp. N3C TaxID=1776758 RepID=UPI00092E0701|nr:mevalonate kinase [Clostridium sp. N3C]SCN22723.1 Galactokinase [Clostridium sp. N3C]
MNTVISKSGMGIAHSKLILVGEHAVVYGKPAIAIPFPLKVEAIVQQYNGSIIFESQLYTGPIEKMPDNMEGLFQCIKATLSYLNKPQKYLYIKIKSQIPLGRGLGSSAAVAVAIVRALFSFFGKNPSQEELFSLVQIAESCTHGNPSGIDMAIVASENPIWFLRDKEIVHIKTTKPLYLVVGDTGRIGDTRTAVEKVRQQYLRDNARVNKSLDRMESIAYQARDAILEGNISLLGKLLDANQEELESLGVSDNDLDSLIDKARDLGALGAKLTGGGLGGCMIALADSFEKAKVIAEDLKNYGAANSWYFSTEEERQ